jgi:hypothetical protein
MASDGSTSAWSALTAAVFLAPFAIPIGVVALVFMKKPGPAVQATTTPEEAEDVDSAASRVFARPELWALIAEHSGFVGAWRLTGVCRASREGAKERLRGDEKVLSFWRQACPELRPLWPADADVSTWEGVTFGGEGGHGVARRRVVKIDLRGKRLTGSVPAELGQLVALQWLDLNNNRLNGSVPEALGQLAAMKWLRLNGNQLTGEVPADLGQLAALEQLRLNNNQQTGEVPAALGDLVALEVLSLANNQLTGEAPAALGRLAALEQLYLNNNQLTGEVSATLGQLAGLV